MADQVNIDVMYDIPALKAQQETVIGFVEKYITLVQQAKPITVALQGAQGLKEQITQLSQLSALLNQQGAASTQAALAEQRLASARLADAKAATEQARAGAIATREQERAGRAAAAANSPYAQLSRTFTDLARRAKDYAITLGNNHPTTVQAIADARRLHERLLALDQATGDSRRNVGNYSSAFSGLNNALSSLALPTVSITALGTAFNSVVDAGSRMQVLMGGLSAVTDSAEEAADVYDYLTSVANKYGQSVETLAGTYKGLAAATRGTSLEGKETRRIFESIVGAGTALKLTNEQVEGSLLAVQQMISKGKVSSEELRGQLGERLPGAYALFAKAAGLTTAELEKQLKAGNILAQDVLPKFATILNETYSDKAIANANSLGNETQRLSNAWLAFASTFADKSGVLDFFATFKNGLASALTAVTGFINNASWKSFAGIFSGGNLREAGLEQQRANDLAAFKNMNKEEREEELKNAQARISTYNSQLEAVKKVQELQKQLQASRTFKKVTGGVVGVDTEETKRLQQEIKDLGGFRSPQQIAELKRGQKQATDAYYDYILTNKELGKQDAENEKRRAQEIADAKAGAGDKEAKAAAKLADKLAEENAKRIADEKKSAYELAKLRQQGAIAMEEGRADFEGFDVNARVKARQRQFVEESKLIDLTREYEIEAINDAENAAIEKAQKEFAGQAGLQQLLTNIVQDAANKRAAVEIRSLEEVSKANIKSLGDIAGIRDDFNKQVQKDADSIIKTTEDQNRRQFDAAAKGLQTDLDLRITRAQVVHDKEQIANQKNYKDGVKSKEQYEADKQRIENDFLAASFGAQVQYYIDLINLSNIDKDTREKALKDLAALQEKYSKDQIKRTEEEEEKKAAIRQQFEENRKRRLMELSGELVGLTGEIFSAGIEREKNDNQERLDAIDKRKEKEIEAETAKVQSTQDRAAAIKVIEAKAEAERNAIEARQRKLSAEKARFERAMNIASIIQSTALAVVGALKPDGFTPLAARIGMAAVIGAIGAAQIAKVIASPIPRYEHGTKDHPGGPALVGERRSELVIEPDGRIYRTPGTPTILHDLPQHSMVLPDAQKALTLAAVAGYDTRDFIAADFSREQLMKDKLSEKLDKLISTVKNKKESHFTFETPLHAWMKTGDSWFKRL